MIIEAHRGDIAVAIDFKTEDQFAEAEYTVTGTLDNIALGNLLNWLALRATAQDGLPSKFQPGVATPHAVALALEFAQFNIVLPDNWDDGEDVEDLGENAISIVEPQ